MTLVRVRRRTPHADSTTPFRNIERLAPDILWLVPLLEDLSQEVIVGLVLVFLVRFHEIPHLLRAGDTGFRWHYTSRLRPLPISNCGQ